MTMKTGNLHFGMSWEAYRLSVLVPAMGKRLLPQSGVNDVAPVKARVNHGRWIVDCECKGAEFAFNEGLFICQSCYNAGHKHQYRRLIFPKARKAIEMVLIQRPEPNRNWSPGEPVAKLYAENTAHKTELLGVN